MTSFLLLLLGSTSLAVGRGATLSTPWPRRWSSSSGSCSAPGIGSRHRPCPTCTRVPGHSLPRHPACPPPSPSEFPAWHQVADFLHALLTKLLLPQQLLSLLLSSGG